MSISEEGGIDKEEKGENLGEEKKEGVRWAQRERNIKDRVKEGH